MKKVISKKFLISARNKKMGAPDLLFGADNFELLGSE